MNSPEALNHQSHAIPPGKRPHIPVCLEDRSIGELVVVSFDTATSHTIYALAEGLDATFENLRDGIATLLWADGVRRHTIHQLAHTCAC